MGKGYEPLSVDDALKHIAKIESYKVELLAGVIVASRIGQFPEDQMALGEELSKIEALDKVFKETGIEESEIIIAFGRHNIQEDPRFKAIIESNQVQLEEHINKAMQEIEQQHIQHAQQTGQIPMAGGG